MLSATRFRVIFCLRTSLDPRSPWHCQDAWVTLMLLCLFRSPLGSDWALGSLTTPSFWHFEVSFHLSRLGGMSASDSDSDSDRASGRHVILLVRVDGGPFFGFVARCGSLFIIFATSTPFCCLCIYCYRSLFIVAAKKGKKKKEEAEDSGAAGLFD